MGTKPVVKSKLDLAVEDVKKGNVVSFDNVEDAKKTILIHKCNCKGCASLPYTKKSPRHDAAVTFLCLKAKD